MEQKPKFMCPLLVVADMPRARKFYESVLGLQVIIDYGENITLEGNFALHLQSHYQMLIDGKKVTTGGNDFEIYFEYDQLDELCHRLEENGVEMVHPLRKQPWQQKVVRFYDPDHHIIEVGEPMEYTCFRLHKEGLTVEEISTASMMPEPYVKAAIEKFA